MNVRDNDWNFLYHQIHDQRKYFINLVYLKRIFRVLLIIINLLGLISKC